MAQLGPLKRAMDLRRNLEVCEARVVGIDLSTGDLELFFGIVDGNSGEHEDFMRKKDAKNGTDKDDELVAVKGFEFSATHVPGSLLSGLVETSLLFLPHEEGGGERFHGHEGASQPRAIAVHQRHKAPERAALAGGPVE